jgi:hypothetical protein
MMKPTTILYKTPATKSAIELALKSVGMLLVSWIALGLVGCKKKENSPAPSPEVKEVVIANEDDQLIFDLIENEDLVLDLTSQLIRQATWFEQFFSPSKAMPQPVVESLFEDLYEYRGLIDVDPETLFASTEATPDFVQTVDWPIDAKAIQANENPWRFLKNLKTQVSWSTIKFGVVSADFENDDKDTFTMHTKVEGRGNAFYGKPPVFGFHGHQDLTWSKRKSGWVLTKWIQLDFQVEKAEQPLFREVLSDSLTFEGGDQVAQLASLTKAQRSYKDELLIEGSKTGRIMLEDQKHVAWTSAMSNFLFPAVSVVDYDNDGFDDLYLTARWGPTQMLRNNGDGTFAEVTRKIGLDFKNLVNCSLFADLDNDGDQDVILGRPLERALILMNDEGEYKDITDTATNLKDLYFVSAISVSDINRDGLLDIYLSTYAPLRDDATWGKRFLEPDELEQVIAHQANRNKHIDLAGPANVILMNRGRGRFRRVKFDETISQWRRSFQTVWSDIDNDGDDDLYVCNDFAPDALLRNDTPRGEMEPVFTDVTQEILLNKGIGFGMGASFGDFDRDGDLDLYVSNMYSKAGKRIIKKVKSVDARVSAAAAGNFLFVNKDGKFDQQAGSDDTNFKVNQVGWSYGGQWADFDNDGELDLYVPSGFYTAPAEISSEVDT